MTEIRQRYLAFLIILVIGLNAAVNVLGNDSLTEDEIEQIKKDQEKALAAAKLREDDYQLAYAIDILKGLSALVPSE